MCWTHCVIELNEAKQCMVALLKMVSANNTSSYGVDESLDIAWNWTVLNDIAHNWYCLYMCSDSTAVPRIILLLLLFSFRQWQWSVSEQESANQCNGCNKVGSPHQAEMKLMVLTHSETFNNNIIWTLWSESKTDKTFKESLYCIVLYCILSVYSSLFIMSMNTVVNFPIHSLGKALWWSRIFANTAY